MSFGIQSGCAPGHISGHFGHFSQHSWDVDPEIHLKHLQSNNFSQMKSYTSVSAGADIDTTLNFTYWLISLLCFYYLTWQLLDCKNQAYAIMKPSLWVPPLGYFFLKFFFTATGLSDEGASLPSLPWARCDGAHTLTEDKPNPWLLRTFTQHWSMTGLDSEHSGCHFCPKTHTFTRRHSRTHAQTDWELSVQIQTAPPSEHERHNKTNAELNTKHLSLSRLRQRYTDGHTHTSHHTHNVLADRDSRSVVSVPWWIRSVVILAS